MSIQETNFKAIADAIREKEGSTEPIPAGEFSARILALETGGAPEGTYMVALESSDPKGGVVSGGGLASEGMMVTVRAEAADGYTFSKWMVDGREVGTGDSYTFTVTGDVKVMAVFEEEKLWEPVWVQSAMPSSGAWRDITYGDGKFVAIKTEGTAAYSTDGINWEQTAIPSIGSGAYFGSVVFGDGKFVAVPIRRAGGQYLTDRCIYSVDGIAWSTATLPFKGYFGGMAYGAEKFVIPSYGYAKAVYSSDGINWEETSMPSSGWVDITYGNGKFVALNGNRDNPRVAYSSDGINWEEVLLNHDNVYFTENWSRVTYGDGKFVAISENGSDVAAYSLDGIRWEKTRLPFAASWCGLAYGDGRFVAVAPYPAATSGQTNNAAYSLDGINWYASTLPAYATWLGIAYGDEKFITISSYYNDNIAAYAIG